MTEGNVGISKEKNCAWIELDPWKGTRSPVTSCGMRELGGESKNKMGGTGCGGCLLYTSDAADDNRLV